MALPTVKELEAAFQLQGADRNEWLINCFQRLADSGESGTDKDLEAPNDWNSMAFDAPQKELMNHMAALALAKESSHSLHALIHTLWEQGCSADSKYSSRRAQVVVYILQALRTELFKQTAVAKKNEAVGDGNDQATRDLHDQLVAHIPAPLLQASGWIKQASNLEKKLKLSNTQTHYKQTKYNLLAEQTEGYSNALSHPTTTRIARRRETSDGGSDGSRHWYL